jgi:NADPH:quinone reductase-like Zn-dependent oxidoreductase
MVHRASAGRLQAAFTSSTATTTTTTTTKPPAAAAAIPCILVHACSGATGAMIVQVAKASGIPASHIFGTCSGKNIPTVTATLGIQAFDYNGDWVKQVKAATAAAGGVDVVFDAVFLNGYFKRGLACLRRGGKYIAYGATNAESPGKLSIPRIVGNIIRMGLQNLFWAPFVNGKQASFYMIADERKASPSNFNKDLNALLDMVKEAKLQPVIGQVWEFGQLKDALIKIEQKATTGRQVVKVAC